MCHVSAANYKLSFLPQSLQDFEIECIHQDMEDIFATVQEACTDTSEDDAGVEAEQVFSAKFGMSFNEKLKEVSKKHGGPGS